MLLLYIIIYIILITNKAEENSHLILLLDVLLSLLAVGAEELLHGPVPQVVDELKDGDEVVAVGVALPVALCLHQRLLKAYRNLEPDSWYIPFILYLLFSMRVSTHLNFWNESLVPLHHQLKHVKNMQTVSFDLG